MHDVLSIPDAATLARLVAQLKEWARELGFDGLGITDTDLSAVEPRFLAWLEKGFHGEMDYMARHGTKRTRPAELVPGTVRVISVRMPYLAEMPAETEAANADPSRAAISRYAMGRDYHKVLRNRLEKLAQRLTAEVAALGLDHQYRAFTDSAPVLEVELAAKAGLGWRGKHTLLLSRDAGSYFFLGELFTNLPLPIDTPMEPHCGRCTACIDICPTQAIVAPGEVDARRCISYLTIELKGAIPVEFRPMIGNRVYGCDDCQLACPWNRFARLSDEADFAVRNGLDRASLVELFGWDEATFQARMAGSAILRIGHERWLRNLAVGLGNAPTTPEVISALFARQDDPSPLVREHVAWALDRHQASHQA